MLNVAVAEEPVEPGGAELMLRVARGDAAAFRVLIDAHAERLRRTAYRMLGDAAEAEDVAQEALLRLWRQAGAWRDSGSGVPGWLTRVTVNACLDRLRRRRFVVDAAVPERADEAPGADRSIDAERLRARTAAAVGRLPERQRAAVVLTYYEDLPNAAAADAMEMNLKAFESLLLRARRALRASLEAEGLLAGAVEIL